MNEHKHERIQWGTPDDLGDNPNKGVCLDCGDNVYRIPGTDVFPDIPTKTAPPVVNALDSDALEIRDAKAERYHDERFELRPFNAKPERRLSR